MQPFPHLWRSLFLLAPKLRGRGKPRATSSVPISYITHKWGAFWSTCSLILHMCSCLSLSLFSPHCASLFQIENQKDAGEPIVYALSISRTVEFHSVCVFVSFSSSLRYVLPESGVELQMTLKELICAVYMHLMPLHCWPLESSISVKAHIWRNRVLICPELPSALVPGSSDLVFRVCGVLFCTFKDPEPNESPPPHFSVFFFSHVLPYGEVHVLWWMFTGQEEVVMSLLYLYVLCAGQWLRRSLLWQVLWLWKFPLVFSQDSCALFRWELSNGILMSVWYQSVSLRADRFLI